MPLADPTIDDRTFDDIVDEIHARIPRYTDEWTDFNDSDPGTTFIQLFAWLTEMLIYRLSKVPELNYVKFMELLGIELLAAEPAETEITFPVKVDHDESTVIVPQRIQVQAAESDESGPIIFETDFAIYALRASIQSVLVARGSSYELRTTENDEASGFEPFGPSPVPDNALLLGFSEALPDVDIELACFVDDGDSAGTTAVECGLSSTTVYASADIVWEFWDGNGWTAVTTIKDETVALTQSGHILLSSPGSREMKATTIGSEEASLYWLRARLDASSYENPPRLLAIRTNTVGATQAETIQNEVVGGSNGSPNQIVQIGNTPVLAGSLVLEIDEGAGFVPWTERSDLLSSGPSDRHFVLNRTTGEILFGDAVSHGAIPVANPSLPNSNIIAREYRIGGGSRGNLAAGQLNSLLTSVTGIDSAAVSNLIAASGGSEEESVDEAKDRAAQVVKNRCRAVTADDFEAIAAEAANIKRARAIPLKHPDYPDTEIPGVVTVIVVPDSDSDKPVPSEGTLRTVCAYLDERRLLTSEVYVVRPTYRHIEVRGEVIAEDTADLADVFSEIDERLSTYFHPLTGGEDGTGWPFGGDVYFSRLLQQVFDVTGVDRVSGLTVFLDGEEQAAWQDISIGDGELVYSTGHRQVTVQYASDET